MNIGILGAGSWAIALAVLLHKRGHTISMWEFNPQEAEMLQKERELKSKLPGIVLPNDILVSNTITDAIKNQDFVIVAVPAQTTRATIQAMVKATPTDVYSAVRGWVIVSKGIECGTLKLLNEVLVDEIPDLPENKIVILSGPSHAEEVSRGVPTTVVAACLDNELALQIQDTFSTDTFRIYTNNDVVGVELCASVKNVIAVAAGICDGLGFGDNTKGALLTRGMVEMARLGKKLGAHESTFSGLAGFGDLITTCISKHSRNRNIGETIGHGASLKDALAQMTMVAEGVETTKSVYHLAQKHDIDMPITTEIFKALFEGKSPKQATQDLMMRQVKPERD